MTTGSYASAMALAKRLIGKKGKASITLTRPGTGAFDALEGERAAGSNSATTFAVVGLPPGPSATKEIGTLVDRSVLEFHMARLTGALEPEPGDKLPWKGKTYTLIWAANYDPDGSGLVYTKAYGEAGG